MKSNSQPIKVLYVMGCSRCGSTILDSIMGAHPDAIGLGELEKYPAVRDSLNDYCGCGVLVQECPFWEEVCARWMQQVNGTLAEFESLARRYCRLRQLPRLLVVGEQKSIRFRRYSEYICAMFQTVAQVSGASIFIDSSKNPARALALRRVKGIDIRLLHLVRDPRGVAASLLKSWARDPAAGIQSDLEGRPARQAAKAWNLSGRLSDLVGRCYAPKTCMRIQYESILNNTAESIRSIGHLLNVDYTDVGLSVASGEAVEIGHVVAGNRLRMLGSTSLKTKDNWPEVLSDDDTRMVERICGRRMHKYGYGLT